MLTAIPCLLSICCVGGPQQPQAKAPLHGQDLVPYIHLDAARRVAQLRDGGESGNVIVVPLGISTAAITMSQVVGTELEAALLSPYTGGGHTVATATPRLQRLIRELRKRGGEELRIGGRLVVSPDLELHSSVTRLVTDLGWQLQRGRTRKELLSMACDVPGVPGLTHAKGQDLSKSLRASEGRGDRGMVADLPEGVDRIAVSWFGAKLAWQDPFEKSNSQLGAFRPAKDQRIFATFMKRKGNCLIGESADFRVLRLPLREKGFAVDLVLPDGYLDFEGLRGLLAQAIVSGDSMLPKLEPSRVTMILPKVDAQTRWNLMERAGQNGGGRFLAGTQIAAFGMNEEGVGVGSVTMVSSAPSTSRRRKVFHADRPFVAIVRDLETGLVVAAAAIADPGTGGAMNRRKR
jgi:hypothetical protein